MSQHLCLWGPWLTSWTSSQRVEKCYFKRRPLSIGFWCRMGISLGRNFWFIPVKSVWKLQVWVSPGETPEHVCEHSPLSWLGSKPQVWEVGTWAPKNVISSHFPPFILQMKTLRPRKVKGWTGGRVIPRWGQNPGFLMPTHHSSSCHWSEDSKRPAPYRTHLHPFPLLVPRLVCWGCSHCHPASWLLASGWAGPAGSTQRGEGRRSHQADIGELSWGHHIGSESGRAWPTTLVCQDWRSSQDTALSA